MKKTILSLLLAVGLIGSVVAENNQTAGEGWQFSDRPVAYYSFDGNANDSVGGNDGIASDITYDFDRFGNPNQSASFKGSSSSYISINNTNLDLPLPFTISAWVKFQPGQGNENPRIFSTSDFEITTDLDPSGRYLYMNLGGINQEGTYELVTLKSSTQISNNKWDQITAVWSSGVMTLFCDGENVGILSNSIVTPIYSRWPYPKVGVNSGALNQDNYSGLIDDIGIWNTALTSNQVSALYAAQSVPEPSTYALFGLGAIGMLMVMRRKKTA